jgi:AbrB family looped-hinge helix DNA binding protein
MDTTLNMDKAGRIVLPKSIRTQLALSAGDSFELEVSGNRIVLRPARAKARLYKKNGIWVLHTGSRAAPEEMRNAVRQVRDERDDRVSGRHP